MKLQLHALRDAPARPWQNGGGLTRELLAWPAGDWELRVSVATIDRDGPFSRLPGVRRWFAVIEGAGVVLTWPESQQPLAPGDDPIEFDGAVAPQCRLRHGATQDLNLMVRRGRALMRKVRPEDAVHASEHAQGGLYACVAGRWSGPGGAARDLPAQTLLWCEGPSADPAWRFAPHDRGARDPWGFWLGFTPACVPR